MSDLKICEIRGRFYSIARQSVFFFGMMAGGTAALAQSFMPDAQVEANVLRALAGAPELSEESITTRTVYGTVTLSGSVQDEARRRKAETLAANAEGVKKVIDELRLGETAEMTQAASTNNSAGFEGGQSKNAQPSGTLVLQSDGTYAPSSDRGMQNEDGTGGQQQTAAASSTGDAQQGVAEKTVPIHPGDENYPAQTKAERPAYPSSDRGNGQGRQPTYDPNAASSPQARYPADGESPREYPQNPSPSNGMDRGQNQPNNRGENPLSSGQVAGQSVLIPNATMIRVRLNQTLSSNRTPPGTPFDGIVVNDVAAGGAIALPRGASVQGRVVEAQSSGALKGRGEMSLELTQVTLGGKTYALHSDLWARHGGDKTIETVNKTAGFGAAGAVIGALAGGGVGAAVGGGIGAAAGLGSSAASGHGEVLVPSEGVITFHLVQEVAVLTVSQQEMQRLAYGVSPRADPRLARRRGYPYPRVYGGPEFYPGYYRGYYPGYYPRYYPSPYGPYRYPGS